MTSDLRPAIHTDKGHSHPHANPPRDGASSQGRAPGNRSPQPLAHRRHIPKPSSCSCGSCLRMRRIAASKVSVTGRSLTRGHRAFSTRQVCSRWRVGRQGTETDARGGGEVDLQARSAMARTARRRPPRITGTPPTPPRTTRWPIKSSIGAAGHPASAEFLNRTGTR